MTSNIGNQNSYDYGGDTAGVGTGLPDSVDSGQNAGPLSGTFTDQVSSSDGSGLYFVPVSISVSTPGLLPPSNDADYNNANLFLGSGTASLFSNNLSLRGDPKEYAEILQLQDPLTASSINEIASRLGISPQKVIELIQDETYDSYANLVQEEPKKDQVPLLLAFFKPDAVKDKRILDKKNQLLNNINQKSGEDLGFSEDWDGFPPSTEKFNKLLNNLFDMIMESVFENSTDLQKLIKKKSPDEVLRLKTQFKMGTTPSDPELAEVLHQLNLQAQEKFFEKYGLQSFEERNYSQGLLEEFRGKFNDALNEVASLTPPLSQEQINAINQYFLNPNAAVPPDVKQIAEALKASAIQKVPGLSSDLDLSGITITVAGVDSNYAANLQDKYNLLKEAYNLGLAQANAMPDGADKENYLNFLSQISLMLMELHKVVQQLAASAADKNRVMTQMNSENSQNQMKKDMDALKAEQEKIKEMAKTKGLTEFGKWMMVFFACLFTGGLAATIAVPLMAADLIQAEVRGTDQGFLGDALDKISEKLEDAMADILKQIPNPSAELKGLFGAFQGTIEIGVAIVFSGGNPVVACTTLLGHKKTFIDTWNKSAGGSEATAQWAKMGLQLSVQVIMMVVMLIATFGQSWGTIPGFVAQAAAQVSSAVTQSVAAGVRVVVDALNAAAKFLKISSELISITDKGLKTASMVLQVTTDLAMQTPAVVAAALESKNNKLLADIDKIKGDVEKYDEMIRAIMDVLKKTIQILQDANSKLVQFSLDIAHTDEHLYSTSSDIMTGVANSQRG